MTVHCYVEPERQRKTKLIMQAVAAGCDGIVVQGAYLEPRGEGVFWGHRWFSERAIPEMIRQGRRWWLIDNGYWNPSNGVPQTGYHRITCDGLAPRLVDRPADRFEHQNVPIRAWRKTGSHIVVCHPGDRKSVV